MNQAEATVNKIVLESDADVDSPERYVDWLGKKEATGTLKDIRFGVYITTTPEHVLLDNAHEQGIDLDNPKSNGDSLARDYKRLEQNMFRFLNNNGYHLSDEGHDSNGDLTCSAWIDYRLPMERQIEVAKQTAAFYERGELVTVDDLTCLNKQAGQLIYDSVSDLGRLLLDVSVDFSFADTIKEWLQVNLVESADDVDPKDYIMSMPLAPETPRLFYEKARYDPVVAETYMNLDDQYIDFAQYVMPVNDTVSPTSETDYWGWKATIAYPDDFEERADSIMASDLTCGGGFYINSAEDGWQEVNAEIPPDILDRLVADFERFKEHLEAAVGIKLRAEMSNAPAGKFQFRESIDDPELNHLMAQVSPHLCHNCKADLTKTSSVMRSYIDLDSDVCGVDVNGHYLLSGDFQSDEDAQALIGDKRIDLGDDSDSCNACGLCVYPTVRESAEEEGDPKEYLNRIHNLNDIGRGLQDRGLHVQLQSITDFGKWYVMEGFSYWKFSDSNEKFLADDAFVRKQVDEYMAELGVTGYNLFVYFNRNPWHLRFTLALPKNQVQLGYTAPPAQINLNDQPLAENSLDDPAENVKRISTSVADDRLENCIKTAEADLRREYMGRCEITIRRADELADEVASKWCEQYGYEDFDSPEREAVRTALYTMAGEWFPGDEEKPVEESEGKVIKGIDLVKRLLQIGTAQGGFLDFTLGEVKERTFKLQTVDIRDLLKTDNSFAEYSENYEPRDYSEDGGLRATEHAKEMIEPADRYDEPIVVIDGEIRDGWSRTAAHLQNDDHRIKAWVAEPNKVTESKLDVWDDLISNIREEGLLSGAAVVRWKASRTEADISAITNVVCDLEEAPGEDEVTRLLNKIANIVRVANARYGSALADITAKVDVTESTDDVNPEAFIKRMPCKIRARIRADNPSDNGERLLAEFDAALWFQQADMEDIIELKKESFCRSYAADEVAEFFYYTDLMDFFRQYNGEGFEVYIDEGDVKVWAQMEKPGLFQAIWPEEVNESQTDDVDPEAFVKDQPVYVSGMTCPTCRECGMSHDQNWEMQGEELVVSPFCCGCGRPVPDDIDPKPFNVAPYLKHLVDTNDRETFLQLVSHYWDVNCELNPKITDFCLGYEEPVYIDQKDIKLWFEVNAPDWLPLLSKPQADIILKGLRQESAEDVDDPQTVLQQHADQPEPLTAELERLGFKRLTKYSVSNVHNGERIDSGGFRYKTYTRADGRRVSLGLTFYSSRIIIAFTHDSEYNWVPKGPSDAHTRTAVQSAALVRDLDAAMERGAQDSLHPRQVLQALNRVVQHYEHQYTAFEQGVQANGGVIPASLGAPRPA